jgi:hypothetical protein
MHSPAGSGNTTIHDPARALATIPSPTHTISPADASLRPLDRFLLPPFSRRDH